MQSLNHALFLALNASSEPPGLVVLLAIIAAKYLIVLVPLHIAILWLGGRTSIRLVAVTTVLALVMALILNQIIGLVAYMPRPFMIGLGHTLIDHRPSSSFPSNHATVFFTYAAALALCRAWGPALAAASLGLLVAWARIYLGIHFPLDMLGAVGVSIVAAAAASYVMRRYGGGVLRHLDLSRSRLLPPKG